ncbi:hypothetical protein NDU88_002495 [Pleurodeles waltl]|uniref:Uncharacterized protein n=1 Tax=Pleurodeles waltl TaxID=8319 RepID=A0AAV7KUC8_PLEWA|nr:hypothetical protein NDU88_002495 [Pleurodeles waltl]
MVYKRQNCIKDDKFKANIDDAKSRFLNRSYDPRILNVAERRILMPSRKRKALIRGRFARILISLYVNAMGPKKVVSLLLERGIYLFPAPLKTSLFWDGLWIFLRYANKPKGRKTRKKNGKRKAHKER